MHHSRAPLLPAGGPARCVLAVHAHPDDETLATGLALARAVALGGRAHVITATLGEEGEVIPAELSHLEGSPDLADYRHGELHRAIAALGATHSYLGGGSEPVGADLTASQRPRWRDSGMAGTPAAEHPLAFARCDLAEAAAVLARDIAAIGPDLVLSYDSTGGYRHPDHIRAHQVTMAALDLLPDDGRPELFVQLTPDSWVRDDRRLVSELAGDAAGATDGEQAEPRLTIPAVAEPVASGVVPDGQVSHEVVDRDAAEVRDRALREHRTQVSVFDGYFALSNRIAARLTPREGYTHVR